LAKVTIDSALSLQEVVCFRLMWIFY